MMKTFTQGTALLLRVGHIGILIFILLGWLSPWPALFKFYLIFVPLVVLQWSLNDDKCVLTQWEHRLKGTAVNGDKEEGFVESLLKRFFNQMPTKKQLKIGIWSVTCACWLCGAIRFLILWHGHHAA